MITNKAELKAQIVLKEIEALSQVRFMPIIGPMKGRYLAETVHKFKVINILEIGTLIGYSAILMAINLPKEGRVFTIEINELSAKMARENVHRANLDEKITVYTGDALEMIHKIDEEFDMVFIDAAKNQYFDYLKLCENKLKKNGVVFADNVKMFANQMIDYLKYIRDSGKYKSELIDLGFDGVEISIKLF
jgi:predicted O-methyltransferase YrrM